VRGGGGVGRLSTFSTDSACKLDVLWHDCHPLGVNCTQIRVFEQTDEVGLARLLQSHHRGALEAQVRLEVLGNLADETLEGQLADQQLRALLVAANFTKGDGAWAVAMWLLDATGRWGTLASSLRGQLLSGSLAPGRFASGLLRSCHFSLLKTTYVFFLSSRIDTDTDSLPKPAIY
jgi:hypothetical protein